MSRSGLPAALAALLVPMLPVAAAAADPAPFAIDAFDRAVLPMVKAYCVRCHSGADADGETDLQRFRTGHDVLADRKVWRSVLRQLKAEAMPPDGEKRPSQAERTAAVAWLEQALRHVDATKPADPGRVTARRLNRTEYDNTLRDLFGVELKLAAEFPDDDVGYGFDNIGDVLSVSPLRVEQYLNAAERLTAVLLGKADRPVMDVDVSGVDFAVTANKKPRNPSDRGCELVPETVTQSRFEFPVPGEYEIRIQAWGVEKPREKDGDVNERWLEAEREYRRPPDAKPVVGAEVFCDDRSVGRLAVLPGNGTTAARDVYTLRFTAQAGVRTLRIEHRFPADMSPEAVAAHLAKPLLAPRLGLRRVAVRGPAGFGDAKLTPAHEALLRVRPAAGFPPRAALEKILRAVGDRAYRRPLADAELRRLADFAEARLREGRTFEEAAELAVHAMLVSPHFLFRLDIGPRPHDPSAIAPVGDFALASRLSYMLWASMPDDELRGLAAAGRLRDPDVLAAQADRLLADPRSDAFLEAFFGQWLGLRKVPGTPVDPKAFPDFSSELKDDLRRETAMFVESLVRGNHSVLELLQADYTFVNGRLAKFYGLPGVEPKGGFRRVSLAGTQRRGVLTHGSVLLLTSYPDRTSPTRRGAWILETILGEEPPPPPDNVPELAKTQAAAPDLPLRKQLELHRVNPTCVSCHRTMDAIGFGLENFDAVGRWRDADRGRPVDASGDLPGGERFTNPRELIGILSRREGEFVRHFAGKLLTYALGRGLEHYDRPAIDEIAARTAPGRHRFHDVIRQVVLSRPFRFHRGDAQEAKP